MYLARLRTTKVIVILLFVLLIARLFYWQIMSSARLKSIATLQHQSTTFIPANRGEILATDGFPLVTNKPSYLAYLYMPDLQDPPEYIAQSLAPLLLDKESLPSTASAEYIKLKEFDLMESLKNRIATASSTWIPLKRNLTQSTKDQVEQLAIKGLGFDTSQIRHYPEASMSAQLLGFVGSDGTGNQKGYFGLEGYYELELAGRSGVVRQENDASGKPILIGNYSNIHARDGRTLVTHIDRGIQNIVERHLREGIEKYGATYAEVVIMNPQTGAIIAMASEPSYDPSQFRNFDNELYRIGAIGSSYEPGSTFKAIVMAAALNHGSITPNTICNQLCDSPVQIGRFTIRTWNNEYNPRQTTTEILRRSDNVGMIFVARSMGKDNFFNSIKNFGFGQSTGIDLEGESIPKLRDRWGDIDLATGSFGQGIAVTSMQMVAAIGAIANDGVLMRPHLVKEVITDKGSITIEPQIVRRVISREAAKQATQMLITSGQEGESQWAVPKGYNIAGKTGTAQIPIDGHYDKEKTIASFIGFAPGHDPRFVMLTKLKEPTSSPWASETAAPLWFNITQDLFIHLNIQPEL